MAKGQVWLPFEEPKTDRLLEPIASWSNLLRAWAAVKRNRGAPGIDGVTIERFEAHLEAHLRELQAELVDGRPRTRVPRKAALCHHCSVTSCFISSIRNWKLAGTDLFGTPTTSRFSRRLGERPTA